MLALVVVLDAYLIANDIDSRAIPGGHPSTVVTTLSDLCLILYTCEVPILILARGRRLLKDWMFLVDLVIILCGYIELVLNLAVMHSNEDEDLVASIGLLRVLRLARYMAESEQ